MNPVPTFPSVADAMAAVQAGLRFVADADATRMSVQAQAEALQMMERATAIVTAPARASVLSAFTSGQGYSADADYSPRAWLIHKTRVTKVVAVAHTAWAKRMVTHPRVVAALAAEDLSESYGRTICQWTDKLPKTAVRPPTRSSCRQRRRGWTCGTWPGWPRRCTSGPGTTCPMRIRRRGSRTGPFPWSRPSRAPES